MFKTLRNAFKVKDIRDRILFTFLMLIIIRIGSELPAPGVDGEVFKQWWASQSADGLGFFNAITGGSFLNMSVFALNITPYITSSIIIQLLTIAIPKLEEIQRDGEEGRKKMVALTRYVTIVLALIQSIAMTIGFYRGGYLTGQGPLAVIEVITGLTAGSAVLMWIGERITEKGIGNGISIVLVINIISRMPEDMGTLWSQFIADRMQLTPAITFFPLNHIILIRVFTPTHHFGIKRVLLRIVRQFPHNFRKPSSGTGIGIPVTHSVVKQKRRDITDIIKVFPDNVRHIG